MQLYLLTATFAAALLAQTPAAQAPVSPDTIVATVEGKPITAGQLDLLRSTVPGVTQALRSDPASALQNLTFEQYMTDEALKLKLNEATPWKQQIDAATQNVMLSAMVTDIRNHIEVSPGDVEAYYNDHLGKYQQSKIRTFVIYFKPAVVNDPKDPKSAAEAAFAREHSKTSRTEAEARTLADQAVKQLRAGADFAKIVDKFADDENKKSAAEDTMTIKSNGPYPPEIQKAVAGLKAGDVPEPVRELNSFYVIKIAEVAGQSINEVREDITQAIRADRTQAKLEELQKRFRPTILRPDYFVRPGPGK